MARVRDKLREVAVVREHEETLGVVVEATDREHTRLRRDEIDGRPSTFGIAGRRDDPARLVQQVVHDAVAHGDRNPVHFDARVLRVDALAEPGDCAVDRHPAVGDQQLGGAP